MLLDAILLFLICALQPWTTHAMRRDHQARLRQETVDMFYHGYRNYMEHAFPEDELRPLSCAPLTRDRENPGHIGLNDALGNYSLTLIDSLSTLAILAGGSKDESYTGPQALNDFQDGIVQFVRHYGDGRSGPSGQGTRAFGFDLDSKVQVFETVIRGVGGLLSAHLFATGELPIQGYDATPTRDSTSDDPLETAPIKWINGFIYDGQLLRLALDLAQRLLPAFWTETGIPYPRVNLRHGIPFYTNSPLHRGTGDEKLPEDREITETCSAGAGSLVLEFTVLSRLTEDARFEQAAKRAFWEVWGRRSAIGLIGNGIDAERGMWIGPHSGIGAGMDSFFEYALKSHILLSGHDMPNMTTPRKRTNEHLPDPNTIHPELPITLHSADAFLEAWHQAHASVKRYIYTDNNHYPYYSNNHRATGQPYTMWIDSLGAFYPGLLALAGELDEAIEANLVYTALWTRYSALPERWSVRDSAVDSGLGWWPGRPEFIESTYYIYRATKDPWYLYVGEMVLRDIQRRCYTPCGWSGLQDVRTGEKSDRMESFFLGETAKYMYLLFDTDHSLNKLDAAFVFTTEGHPLIIPKRARSTSKTASRMEDREVKTYEYYDASYTHQCPVYPVTNALSGSATAARRNLFHVAKFTGLDHTPNLHGPTEAVVVEDENQKQVTRFRATTNHTLFPWTLPPTLLPYNGTCTVPIEREIAWIEFPPADALGSRFGTSLTWNQLGGPTVKSLSGMRLQVERQRSQISEDQVWWITHAAGVQLGRHEVVFFHAAHVQYMKDGAFTCLRRKDAVEIILLLDDQKRQPAAESPVIDSLNATEALHTSHPEPSAMAPDSLFKSLLRAVTSVFDPDSTGFPASDSDSDGPTVRQLSGLTATGAGAFPLPAIFDTPSTLSPDWNAKNPLSNFPWTSIYLADQACGEPLPDAVPRNHQVIVILRGGCSFNKKLERIPSFPQDSRSLQLVIIVDEDSTSDEDDDAGHIRPLLAEIQRSPRGMKRLNGIPLVMVHGARGTYDEFGAASGVGLRREYVIQSQGLVIENALVV